MCAFLSLCEIEAKGEEEEELNLNETVVGFICGHSEDVHLLRTPCSFFLSICRLPNRLLELNINRQRSNFVFHSLQLVYRLHTLEFFRLI